MQTYVSVSRQCFQSSSSCFVPHWSGRQEDLAGGCCRGGFVLYSSPAHADVPPQSYSPASFWTALKPLLHLCLASGSKRGQCIFLIFLFWVPRHTRPIMCVKMEYAHVLRDECSVHCARAGTGILWDGKFKPPTQDVQYTCNNARHWNKTAWFSKENSPPAQIDFSRICHSCSVFKNQSTSTQVPIYRIRHLILDSYFWNCWPVGLILILFHQLSLVQMHQLTQWSYFYRKPVPCLENQDLWQSRNSNILVFFLRNTQIVVIVLNILKRVTNIESVNQEVLYC